MITDHNISTDSDIIHTCNPSILIDGCNALGICLSGHQVDQFVTFYQMMYDKNRVMNLTAITQWEEVQVKHFLDSLLLCKAADLRNGLRILDMGTGAGFPGIPLKIAFPDIDIVLADSLNKRIQFIHEVINELGLSGITALHGRAEDLGRQKIYRESFDLVVSRAVANLSALSEYCLPFVKISGQFVSYKSAGVADEVENAKRAIEMLGGGSAVRKTFLIPCSNIERTFVIVDKEKTTDAKYPRKAGMPSKKPL